MASGSGGGDPGPGPPGEELAATTTEKDNNEEEEDEEDSSRTPSPQQQQQQQPYGPPPPTPPTAILQHQDVVVNDEGILLLGSSFPTTSSPPDVTSYTVVKASELFPKPLRQQQSQCDDNNKDQLDLPVPFLELPGEGVRYFGKTRCGGTIVVTNYRLNVTPDSSSSSSPLINVPLGIVEGVELRELFYVQVACKDAKCFRIAFDNNGSAEEWYRRLWEAIAPATRIEDVFALAHFAWARERGFEELDRPWSSSNGNNPPTSAEQDSFQSEVSRLRFDLESTWRVTQVNRGHKFCPTYPEDILIPRSITDADLEKVSMFRSARRIPSIVWRHAGTGAVLARCSQPEVGWLGWRSNEDEKLVQAIAEACSVDVGTSSSSSSNSSSSSSVIDDVDSSSVEGGGYAAGNNSNGYANGTTNGEASIKDLTDEASKIGEVKKVLIIDARSYTAAIGNRARGGGVECQEYYPNAEIQFMNLGNIHSIRKSFLQLRSLCGSSTDQAGWFHALDATKWFSHISGLLKAALRCATALEREGRPVIVHCSDGWDRTPQIVALAELFLDPYYRTIEGFQVLVEREWLSYGHKMADRCGNAFATSDTNERSPIFLQWLDCVHQLLHQFPCHFEFNFTYLVKLTQHAYSNLFGNFLCNSTVERRKHHLHEKTRSLWEYTRLNPTRFRNFLYDRSNSNDDDSVIWPRTEVRDLLLWQDVYVSDLKGGCWPGSTPEQQQQLPPPPTNGVVVANGNGIANNGNNNSSSNGSTKSGCASDSDSWDNGGREDGDLRDVTASRQLVGGGGEKQDEVETKETNVIEKALENIKVTDGSKSDKLQQTNGTAKSEQRSSAAPIPSNSSNGGKKHVRKGHANGNSSHHPHHLIKTSSNNIESSTDTLVPEEDRLLVGETTPIVTSSFRKGGHNSSNNEEHHPRPSNGYGGSNRHCSGTSSIDFASSSDIFSHPPLAPGNNKPRQMSRTTAAKKFDRYPIDSDGLVSHDNKLQQRMVEIFTGHRAEMQLLRRDLHFTRLALSRQQGGGVNAGGAGGGHHAEPPLESLMVGIGNDFDDACCGGSGNGGGCGAHTGSTASDISSWEAVDEREAKPTLWVPDHALVACMRCHTSFWFGRRKHHCRNCGGLFCNECSNQFLPMPTEHLYHPVRICVECFHQLEDATAKEEDEEEDNVNNAIMGGGHGHGIENEVPNG